MANEVFLNYSSLNTALTNFLIEEALRQGLNNEENIWTVIGGPFRGFEPSPGINLPSLTDDKHKQSVLSFVNNSEAPEATEKVKTAVTNAIHKAFKHVNAVMLENSSCFLGYTEASIEEISKSIEKYLSQNGILYSVEALYKISELIAYEESKDRVVSKRTSPFSIIGSMLNALHSSMKVYVNPDITEEQCAEILQGLLSGRLDEQVLLAALYGSDEDEEACSVSIIESDVDKCAEHLVRYIKKRGKNMTFSEVRQHLMKSLGNPFPTN